MRETEEGSIKSWRKKSMTDLALVS